MLGKYYTPGSSAAFNYGKQAKSLAGTLSTCLPLLLLSLSFSFLSIAPALAQGKVAVKTNILHGAGTLTPNIGAEIGLSKRSTLDLWGAYNPWNREGDEQDNKKLVHWILQPEYRYWLCERFNGHFFGVHALYSAYNISQHNIPLLLEKGSKDFRYEGTAVGGGLSYGYQLMLGKRWNMEFTIGVGYLSMKYDKFKCAKCSEKIGTFKKEYYGPTKVGISLVFLIH